MELADIQSAVLYQQARIAFAESVLAALVARWSDSGRWVSFAQIIDWFARDEQGKRERRLTRHKKRATAAREELWASLQNGEFDTGRNGRTLAIIADAGLLQVRGSFRLQFSSRVAGAAFVSDDIKEKVFVTNAAARKWFETKNYRLPDWLSQTRESTAVITKTSTGSGRQLPSPDAGKSDRQSEAIRVARERFPNGKLPDWSVRRLTDELNRGRSIADLFGEDVIRRAFGLRKAVGKQK